MDKRIAVTGLDDEGVRRFGEALPKGVLAQAVTPGDGLPPDTAAIAGTSEDAAALAEAATALGARQDALLILLAQAVDAREGIPLENAPRVLGVASTFGRALGLGHDDMSKLQRATVLHDIGKLKVANDVLLTKAMLTHEEWEQMRKHTVMGGEMLRGLDGFQDVAEIVRSHHECYDGTGYPDGLEGEDIPYLARVIKIVDVFCAMTGPRHYRKGMASPDEAAEHIQEEKDKHFQGDLAQVFLDDVLSKLDER